MSDDRIPERYSRITRRMWGDCKFRSLSAPTANAQDLWIYLLTAAHCGRIPGLFVLGPLYLAERLRWPVEDTRRCFQEILDQGLAQWDPETLLCWLPNAVRHNEPANPNVVLGWAEEWRGMPECSLLCKARRGIRRQLADISDAFVAAFDKMAGKPSRKPFRKPLPKGPTKPSDEASAKPSGKASRKQDPDPDQDPDQEQEQKIPPSEVDLASAIPDARARDAEAGSGGEGGRLSEKFAGQDARPEPAEQPAAPDAGPEAPEDQSAVAADPVERFLAAFDQRWSRANGGRARAEGPRDRTNAGRIVTAAREQAPRAGDGVTPAQVLEHWTAQLIADQRREAIMDPLACLLSRIGGYGLPLPQTRRKPRAREEPPGGPAATPREIATILKGSPFLAKTTERRAVPAKKPA